MKKIYIIASLIFITIISMACLNYETAVLQNGVVLYEEEENGKIPRGHTFLINNFPKVIRELDSLYNVTKDVRYLSDKGYVLIIQNKFKEAIQLYLKVEALKPNRYMTASNIGTAYELIGDNKNALNWLNKAYTLDKTGHKGSEWIHINILEAKIKGDSCITSKYLLKHDLGNDVKPKYVEKYNYQRLRTYLYFQLQERMSFIKTKDKIMAQLLLDLGNISINIADYEEAIQIFKLAKFYGANEILVKKKIDLATAGYNKLNSMKK
ncbi:MAG: hypothetical protein RLZZ175_1391 [Bacteroidota bacterium]|jgi:hypothetical protein